MVSFPDEVETRPQDRRISVGVNQIENEVAAITLRKCVAMDARAFGGAQLRMNVVIAQPD